MTDEKDTTNSLRNCAYRNISSRVEEEENQPQFYGEKKFSWREKGKEGELSSAAKDQKERCRSVRNQMLSSTSKEH